MRNAAAGAATLLVLTGCSTAEQPTDPAAAPPSESDSATVTEQADLEAVCDALGETVTLPSDEAIDYTVTFNEPTGWSTNAPVCDIEPDGEYFDVALEAASFGRAEFDYGAIADDQAPGYPEYDPDRAATLLTLDQAEPLRDELPCADEPCDDGIHGYLYSYRFETVAGAAVVIAQFDYLTTDVSGDLQTENRDRAVAEFTSSMEAVLAELG